MSRQIVYQTFRSLTIPLATPLSSLHQVSSQQCFRFALSQLLEVLVGQPDPASFTPGVEAQVGGVPDVLAWVGAVPLEGAFGQDQVVGLSSFVHVLVVHPFDGSLADHDHAAFVPPFGQQAERPCWSNSSKSQSAILALQSPVPYSPSLLRSTLEDA
jgi:hypothetical protein